MKLQEPATNLNIYRYSFFPRTIRDWNFLSEEEVSAPILAQSSSTSTKILSSLSPARDVSVYQQVNEMLLRDHNWQHFAHRPQCNVTANSNFAIFKTGKDFKFE